VSLPNVESRTCLVTGGSRGIGRGIAEELGREGADVAVNYRSSEGEAHEVVDTIEDAGGRAIAVQGDVADHAEVEAMCENVHDAFGPVDVLVNNAGITVDEKFENMTREDWDRVMRVNLGGVFNCTHCLFDDVKRAEHGRLINISSVVGQQGTTGRPTTPPRSPARSASPGRWRWNWRDTVRQPTVSPPASSPPTCWRRCPSG
jgi:3-oxoacyl-[acyl-carrier protein] reductase